MKTSRTPQLLVVYTAVVLALTGVVACARADAVTTPGFFVDRQTAANRAKQQYPADAAALETIAGAPIVRWFSQPEQGPAVARAQVDSYVDRAWAAQSLPIMALYGAPDRDCGGYSAGGARSLDEYRGWIDAVSTGIAGRPVGVIIEPDGLANVTCLSPDKSAIRIAAISYAVLVLSRNPQALVYVDIGHSRWLSVPVAAQLLRSVGVDKVRGFSLNVSNFFTTAEEQAYGEQLVAALGSSSHYVIDTSRNGNGPAPASDPKNWCNPAGRALGERPTRNTTAPRADAYLWVKHPGESDGPCGRGEPTSGHWFNSYALSLIANAA